MSRFTDGRNVLNKVNKQMAYGLELKNLLEEKKQNIKKKGMKRNGL